METCRDCRFWWHSPEKRNLLGERFKTPDSGLCCFKPTEVGEIEAHAERPACSEFQPRLTDKIKAELEREK